MPGRRDRSAHRPERSNSRSWVAFAALAAVFTIAAVGRAQEEQDDARAVRSQFRIADSTLDKRIFGEAADRAAARNQLETLLAHRLAGIAELCRLSDAQRDKLRLAGQGALAKTERGEVVVLGSSLWWNWIAGDVKSGAQNSKLLGNLLTRGLANKSGKAQ